ncbi:uncharacterized protein Triagg1_1399 [Trichoderma aggressivum f. europaeum]|uniref:Uncharacterized protein n=1 Tax=Trichoderma aggressivum f. europaeum TaxID=173218 RepID=A0AAE1M6G0_9HYPO|nr:hypothetical protein Triagg1_1399 [Trichoderma aggressivum f. europaeum]
MVHHGFLVPDNYVSETPDDKDMNISSVFWGLSLGIAIFAAVQAGRQSYHSWKRKHRITTYVALIWGEWIASIIIGALTWCFQREYVGPRVEKVIFCIIDLSLNVRFMYLVRSRLIKSGLSKYIPLYRLNLVLQLMRNTKQVSLIGLMSLPNNLSYLQFHPVAYLLKLSIEMNMAELTAKIAKSQNLGAIQRLSFITPAEQKPKHHEGSSVHIEIRNDGDIERAVAPPGRIQVSVKTAVTRQTAEESDDAESRDSSTQE